MWYAEKTRVAILMCVEYSIAGKNICPCIVVSKLKSKKPPKVTITFEKVKYLEKLAQYVPSNAMPSHIAKIHRKMK